MSKVIPVRRFLRVVSAVTAVAVLSAYGAPAWADPPVATVALPTDASVPTAAPAPVTGAPPTIAPMWPDQPAPFSGVLLSPEATAVIIARADAIAKQLQLAIDHQRALDAAQQSFQLQQQASTCSADKSVLQAQLTDAQKQYDAINAQLKKVGSAPSAPTWIAVGAVGGIVLTVVTVLAVSKATK